ncbi:MAG: hypothetical protein J7647_30255 [Cyanobacteria bacterium SBLK]|nr:hypothetical protein [Cyanobacteria bacterium SBLK]
MALEKAQFISDDSNVATIEFLFNPTTITVKRSFNAEDEPGTGGGGLPKVNYKGPCSAEVTLSEVILDTYETGVDVMTYITKFETALEKNESLGRPPIYTLTWGSKKYIKCFITSLTYQLTRFYSDGVPVQAKITNLTMKEVETLTSTVSSTSYDTTNRSAR